MDISALTTGITDLFLADADLLAALGGSGSDVLNNQKLYDTKAPQNTAFPYVVFQYIAGSIDMTFDKIVELTIWQFSIFHKDEDPLDKTTISDVFKKLAAAYDDAEATMTVSGYDVTWVTRGASNFLQTEDETQQMIINYEIRMEKAR